MSFLRIHRKYTFNGDLDKFTERFEVQKKHGTKKGYYLEWYTDGEFTMIASMSIGTFRSSSSGFYDQIKINVRYLEVANSNNNRVEISTKNRWTILLPVIGSLLFGGVILNEKDQPWFAIPFVVMLCFGCFFWFRYIYRLQQKVLVEFVEGCFKLQRM